jgi:hypothetical protein
MKIRFVKEGNKYTLQVKNFIGMWRTQKEKICSDGGCFYQAYIHENKQTLLRHVLLNKYWLKHHRNITEYPTIKKYKPFDERYN